ncbi:MAG: hypothetical protein Greene07147_260 [Parcubacteria group bacterium Greene0714_7]|nr:MAG: hypothetical protein Greene07147_260 [Parcubacteria group bacterium Greene0714_7]
MSSGKRETLRIQGERNFARLVDNIRSATSRALEQMTEDWSCTVCGLAGIPEGSRCPTCNPYK